jgi:transcriptional regulator with PAS, ATPase and Fis domain
MQPQTDEPNGNKGNYLLESQSPEMQNVLENVTSVAQTRSTILISGESGTGKSVLAKFIHRLSDRKNNKFINVHCGAFAENLIESELFGHEKGAFTGAIRQKLGKFELADKGTIFLDEISDLSESAQVRLLQVIQERFVQRVGGEENIEIDIRIIAATNTDLKKLVAEKKFREDLYYRLDVFQIEIPPLRRRREDIDLFTNHILNKLNQLYGKGITTIEPAVQNQLKQGNWTGNIRELENVLEKTYILEKSKILTSTHFPAIDKVKGTETDFDIAKNIFSSMNLNEERKKYLENFERLYLLELLRLSKGNMKEASVIAGVGVRQLNKFISKHQMNKRRFVPTDSISNLPH